MKKRSPCSAEDLLRGVRDAKEAVIAAVLLVSLRHRHAVARQYAFVYQQIQRLRKLSG